VGKLGADWPIIFAAEAVLRAEFRVEGEAVSHLVAKKIQIARDIRHGVLGRGHRGAGREHPRVGTEQFAEALGEDVHAGAAGDAVEARRPEEEADVTVGGGETLFQQPDRDLDAEHRRVEDFVDARQQRWEFGERGIAQAGPDRTVEGWTMTRGVEREVAVGRLLVEEEEVGCADGHCDLDGVEGVPHSLEGGFAAAVMGDGFGGRGAAELVAEPVGITRGGVDVVMEEDGVRGIDGGALDGREGAKAEVGCQIYRVAPPMRQRGEEKRHRPDQFNARLGNNAQTGLQRRLKTRELGL